MSENKHKDIYNIADFDANWISKPISKLIKCSTIKSYVPLDDIVSKNIATAISGINPGMLHTAINYVCDDYLFGTDNLENKNHLELVSNYPLLEDVFIKFKDLKSHLDFITLGKVGPNNFAIMEDNGTFLPSSIIYFRTIAALYEEFTTDVQKDTLYKAFIQGLAEYSAHLTINTSYDIPSSNLRFLLPKNYLQSKADRLVEGFFSSDYQSFLEKIEKSDKEGIAEHLSLGVNPLFVDLYIEGVQDRFSKIVSSVFNKSRVIASESYDVFFNKYPDPRMFIDILLEPNTTN